MLPYEGSIVDIVCEECVENSFTPAGIWSEEASSTCSVMAAAGPPPRECPRAQCRNRARAPARCRARSPALGARCASRGRAPRRSRTSCARPTPRPRPPRRTHDASASRPAARAIVAVVEERARAPPPRALDVDDDGRVIASRSARCLAPLADKGSQAEAARGARSRAVRHDGRRGCSPAIRRARSGRVAARARGSLTARDAVVAITRRRALPRSRAAGRVGRGALGRGRAARGAPRGRRVCSRRSRRRRRSRAARLPWAALPRPARRASAPRAASPPRAQPPCARTALRRRAARREQGAAQEDARRIGARAGARARRGRPRARVRQCHAEPQSVLPARAPPRRARARARRARRARQARLGLGGRRGRRRARRGRPPPQAARRRDARAARRRAHCRIAELTRAPSVSPSRSACCRAAGRADVLRLRSRTHRGTSRHTRRSAITASRTARRCAASCACSAALRAAAAAAAVHAAAAALTIREWVANGYREGKAYVCRWRCAAPGCARASRLSTRTCGPRARPTERRRLRPDLGARPRGRRRASHSYKALGAVWRGRGVAKALAHRQPLLDAPSLFGELSRRPLFLVDASESMRSGRFRLARDLVRSSRLLEPRRRLDAGRRRARQLCAARRAPRARGGAPVAAEALRRRAAEHPDRQVPQRGRVMFDAGAMPRLSRATLDAAVAWLDEWPRVFHREGRSSAPPPGAPGPHRAENKAIASSRCRPAIAPARRRRAPGETWCADCDLLAEASPMITAPSASGAIRAASPGVILMCDVAFDDGIIEHRACADRLELLGPAAETAAAAADDRLAARPPPPNAAAPAPATAPAVSPAGVLVAGARRCRGSRASSTTTAPPRPAPSATTTAPPLRLRASATTTAPPPRLAHRAVRRRRRRGHRIRRGSSARVCGPSRRGATASTC